MGFFLRFGFLFMLLAPLDANVNLQSIAAYDNNDNINNNNNTPNVDASSIAAVVATSLPSPHRPPFGEEESAATVHDPPNYFDHSGSNSDSTATYPVLNHLVVTVTMTPTTATTITFAAATATSAPTAVAIAAGSPMAADNPTECRLLGSFAILVQLALGGLALLSLVYKRWRERPQRPVKIWFFDASKQVFGSVLVHGANVFMSLLTSGRFNITTIDPAAGAVGVVRRGAMMLLGRGSDEYVPNPCSFYLLNLAIDTTLGIPILIIIVRVLTRLVTYTPLGQPPESVQSGHYGTPPSAWWWLKQSFIYFCGLMGMKLCVLVLFMTMPWLEEIGDWALGWTEGNEKLQIVFVMMLFPLIMNAMQYYIIDSYIKKQEAKLDDDDDATSAGAAANTIVYNELTSSETEDSGDEEEQLTPKASGRGAHPRVARRDTPADLDLEYDPDVDGDSQTVIGSSSSHTSNRGVLQKELVPRE